MVIVLDAGALLALEQNDREMWKRLKKATTRKDTVMAPASVVAQTWRGRATQARLAAALVQCVVASFDDAARAIGELCGRSSTSDVCDAHVALVASRYADVLYTSDPDDMVRLIAAAGRRRPAIVTV
jgi:hypothetical protein